MLVRDWVFVDAGFGPEIDERDSEVAVGETDVVLFDAGVPSMKRNRKEGVVSG